MFHTRLFYSRLFTAFLLAGFLFSLSTRADNTIKEQSGEPGVLGNMIDGINTDSQKNNRQAANLNRANQDMMDASTASDITVDRARQKVNQANLEAEAIKSKSTTQANRTDRDESWSSVISDGVTEGVDSGAAILGGAIGGGINAAAKQKRDE